MIGLPEFDFPRLDPILYKDGRVVLNRNLIYAEGNVINATVFGLALSRFLDVRPHFLDDVFQLEMDILIPKIITYSYIDGQANIFGMRANGRGMTQYNLYKEQYIKEKQLVNRLIYNDKELIKYQITRLAKY